MKVERNDPCPCGSGKKYKKCCGSSTSSAPTRQDYAVTLTHLPAFSECTLRASPGLEIISRSQAYRGALGRKREVFCREYTAHKQARIGKAEKKLRQEAAAKHQSISCTRGCAHCCRYPVEATLQECECIVYYLYQHEGVLRRFLQAFPGWRDRVLGIEACFRRYEGLSEKIMRDKATAPEVEIFYEQCGLYGQADIPCPFLGPDGACAIYEVRPYVCAGVVATTPPEWCNSSSPNLGQAQELKYNFQAETDMPYFAGPASNYVYATMPFLVYRLLVEGYAALACVPGLAKLTEA